MATSSFYSVFDTNFLSSLSKNGSDSGPSAKDAVDWRNLAALPSSGQVGRFLATALGAVSA